ncbi:hypothetical protein [Haloparvum sp. AD34]
MKRDPSETFDGLIDTSRRAVLKALTAGSVTSIAVPGTATARGEVEITIRQGGQEVATVSPISTDRSIENFYRYDEIEGASANTPMNLRESGASKLFFYRQSGSNKPLSLVVIHDTPDDGSGGDVRFDFQPNALPSGGSWAVQDDPGEGFNRKHADWGWAPCCTDGGAYRGGFGKETEVTINPSFNDGIGQWDLLDGDGSVAADLSMGDAVTLSVGDRPKTLQKQELIDTIRSEGSDLMLDFRAENLDERAEELLAEIDQALSNENNTFQYEEALDRMLTAEAVTVSATRRGKQPGREIAANITELLIMLAFVVIAKAAVKGAGRLGSITASKLDDIAAKGRRGIKGLAGRSVLPSSALSQLDDIIDEVTRRVDDWVGRNSDDIEDAGEEIVEGSGTINGVFGLLSGHVVEGLAAIKEFAIDSLSVLFYDLYMTDDEEFNDEGERIEPPGIGQSINNRMDDLDAAIDEERLEADGGTERQQAKTDQVSEFEERQQEFLTAMELFDDVTAGASIAVLVLAAIAIAFYAISAVLSASGIGLVAAGVLSTASSYLVTVAGGLGTIIIAITGFSIILGFGWLRNWRREHDATVDFVVNYETSGGGA